MEAFPPLLKWGLLPLAVLAHRFGCDTVRPVEVTARHQTAVQQARIACTLERFRLLKGEFPEDLADLAPQFLEQIPRDLIHGQAMHYRRTERDRFVLYSVGWNAVDAAAGGTDWGWRYPAAPEATDPAH